jgi:hypothetical protein
LNRHFGIDAGLVQISGTKAVQIAACAFNPEKECDHLIIAIDGREIDLRMLVQLGRFTLHSDHTPMEALPDSTRWLRRYIIPKEHKYKVRNQLSSLGIRHSNLFPDLTNLAAELRAARFE